MEFWHWSKAVDPLAGPAAFGGAPADAFDVTVPSLPGFGFPGPLTGFGDVNFWKVSGLWHTLMTKTPGYEKYTVKGCDIGGIVSGRLGHKYADELYGIHIGSGLPLDFFTGPRTRDFIRSRPLTDDQPADARAHTTRHTARPNQPLRGTPPAATSPEPWQALSVSTATTAVRRSSIGRNGSINFHCSSLSSNRQRPAAG